MNEKYKTESINQINKNLIGDCRKPLNLDWRDALAAAQPLPLTKQKADAY
jgi:hypothetical protein